MSGIPAVYVDGRVIDHPTAGSRGIGRYSVSLVQALIAANATVVVLVDDDTQRSAWLSAVPEARVVPLRPRVLRTAPRDSWFLCTQLMLHPIPLDVIPRAVTEVGMRVMAVMYDVIPQRWRDRYLTDPAAANMSRLRVMLARTVDHFLAISSFTARTAAIELGVPVSRFTVIGSAVDPRFVSGDGPRERPVSGDVVANSGPDERKNTEGLIRAWSKIPRRVRGDRRLVIVCAVPVDVRRRWVELSASLGADDIVILGSVSDDELMARYRTCSLAVFPSFEEGFGLPVVEAAACGAPVVCSDTSSMPEVMACEEALFNPYDVGDMSRVIERALTDAAYRHRLIAAASRCAERWNWRRVGADAVAAFGGRSDNSDPIGIGTRPRIALIGRHDDELITAWPSGSEVVPIDDVSGSDQRAAGMSAWGWGRFVRAHDFDSVITRITDNAQIANTALATAPGHVWVTEGVAIPACVANAESVIVESVANAAALPTGVPTLVLGSEDIATKLRAVADWVLKEYAA